MGLNEQQKGRAGHREKKAATASDFRQYSYSDHRTATLFIVAGSGHCVKLSLQSFMALWTTQILLACGNFF